mgnify:FL=1|jgi:predicted ribosomally synthesized peptide with SipW-like signal peptide
MLVASIVMLSFIGISYAYWDDSVSVNDSVTTGEVKPQFSNEYKIEDIEGEGNIYVNFVDNNTTMNITGEVKPGYKATLYYSLCNGGTIPIKLYGQNINQSSEYNIMPNQQLTVIYPYDNAIGSELNIQADESINNKESSETNENTSEVKESSESNKNASEIKGSSEAEKARQWNYEFQIDLPFEQFNY